MNRWDHAAASARTGFFSDGGRPIVTEYLALRRLDRSGVIAALTFVAAIAVLEFTWLDVVVQDHFYDFTRHTWLLGPEAIVPRLLFHDLPQLITIGAGILLAAFFLVPSLRRGPSARHWNLSPRVLLCAAVTLASIPATVALGKKLTNRFCPRDMERYGGDICFTRLGEAYPPDSIPNRRGSCFPAGHASGGFALIALCSLARRRRMQFALLTASFALGWIAGGYQMLAGVHFISHTLVSMCIAWLAFIAWRRLFGLANFPLQSRRR